MHTLDEIRDAALRLPISDRIALAEELFDSLPAPPAKTEEELRSVLASRIAALESGEEEPIDGPTALAEIRRELRRRTKAS